MNSIHIYRSMTTDEFFDWMFPRALNVKFAAAMISPGQPILWLFGYSVHDRAWN